MRLAEHLHHSRPSVPLLLAFCSCFVDVVCVLGLFHTFTAFITGTLVVLCTELLEAPDQAPLKLVVLATFLVASLGWYLLLARRRDRARLPLRVLLLAEGLLIILFMLVAGLSAPLTGPLATETLLAVVCATVAMSLHNVIMNALLNRHTPTTIMTGNALKLVAGLVEGWLAGRSGTDAEAGRRRAASHGATVLAFAAGGLAGAWLVSLAGFWALALPAALVLLLGAVQGPVEA
ncbi:Uncharacterized membrane protein YoaK, UPF0700 family [Tistlia consotensis]|uniref:Uncharacterized membrane protein YoaK, UPF0700 family n=1 Tax=Tistlia consotensis USBA 355 TaxID=560819 RepID=A0A1Y6C5N1_9PROT|nr:DUF1275 family protein [Tistlia consotensis]SMF46846.1 Uncharacterized membrane protein YoaK, UPF0700 family [Tistlia consotensis USBA 355]SNR77986.1 Uncharacterized membrane protein YoaK, UPF0700 family [Tistlia consotensis]